MTISTQPVGRVSIPDVGRVSIPDDAQMTIGIQFRINDITPQAVSLAAKAALVDNPGFTILDTPVMIDLSCTVYKGRAGFITRHPEITDSSALLKALVGTIINDPSQVKKLTISKAYTNTQTMLYLLSVRPLQGELCQQP